MYLEVIRRDTILVSVRKAQSKAAFPQRKSGFSSPHWNSRLIQIHTEKDSWEPPVFTLINSINTLIQLIHTSICWCESTKPAPLKVTWKIDESFSTFLQRDHYLEKAKRCFNSMIPVISCIGSHFLSWRYLTPWLLCVIMLWKRHLRPLWGLSVLVCSNTCYPHDIPVFQNDSFPLNVTIEIQECFFLWDKSLSCLPSKMTLSTVHRALMGFSLAWIVHLLSKFPSSVKKLEIFPSWRIV